MDTDTLVTEAAADDTVVLGPEMTIAQAATWRDTLVDALCASAGDLTLDLSAVTDIDSAGVQLLLATRRSLAEAGSRLAIVAASSNVRASLALFGLACLLDPATGDAS